MDWMPRGSGSSRRDALTWQPPRGVFDLVATHFFLDCFRRDELERLVAKVAASATDEARWLLADFRVPASGWRKWRARVVLCADVCVLPIRDRPVGVATHAGRRFSASSRIPAGRTGGWPISAWRTRISGCETKDEFSFRASHRFMSIKLIEQDGGKELEVHISGKLTHADYQRFEPEFERLIKQHGRIRVLFDMDNFHGWQAGALWDDIKLDFKHFSDIERLAIIGDKKWERGMARFCRPFTTAKIRFFDRAVADAARAWLAGKFDSSDLASPLILRVFQTKDQTKAFYNKISHVYDLLSDRSEAPMRKAGLELLKARVGENVLEIGFGTGHSVVSLARAIGPTGQRFRPGFVGPDGQAGQNQPRQGQAARTRPASVRRRGRTALRRLQYGCGVHEFHAGALRHAGNSKSAA